MLKETAVLFATLEAVGREWAEKYCPQDLLLDETKFGILLQIDDLVWDPHAKISAEDIRQHAPTFYDQFGEATLRQLGVPFGHAREVVGAALNG